MGISAMWCTTAAKSILPFTLFMHAHINFPLLSWSVDANHVISWWRVSNSTMACLHCLSSFWNMLLSLPSVHSWCCHMHHSTSPSLSSLLPQLHYFICQLPQESHQPQPPVSGLHRRGDLSCRSSGQMPFNHKNLPVETKHQKTFVKT